MRRKILLAVFTTAAWLTLAAAAWAAYVPKKY
jgi:hypothetical protein